MSERRISSTWVLILTSMGFFMSMMDSMIVTTASTAIRNDFKISVNALQWALNSYNITIAAVLLIGVTMGDRLGHRFIYNLGLFIFLIGSVFCALSTNITLLVISRIIEGVGASVITPMSMAILTASISPAQRGKALGIWSGIGGLALIIGPSLGGLIVAKLTWQWIFWINVPIGLLLIIFSQQKLLNHRVNNAKINVLDPLLIVLSSAGIIWALSESTSKNVELGTILVGGVSLLLGIIFLIKQRFSTVPMIPLTFFKSSTFSGANIVTFLLYASMYGVVFFLPQYLQLAHGETALIAGLQLLPWTGTLVIIAPFAGKAVDRFGERTIAALGLFLQGIGYVGMTIILMSNNNYSAIVIPLILAGAGLSMAGPALQKAVIGAVHQAEIGKASGVYNMFRLFGGAVGVTISVMIFYQFGSIVTVGIFSSGFKAAMIGAGGLSLLGILFSLEIK